MVEFRMQYILIILIIIITVLMILYISLSCFLHAILSPLIDLLEAKPEVAMAMLRWAYTDELELSEDDAFLIDLMKLANRFQLHLLRERWACHLPLSLTLPPFLPASIPPSLYLPLSLHLPPSA